MTSERNWTRSLLRSSQEQRDAARPRIPGVCLGHPDGFAFTMSRHHRLPRSHGGTSDLSNLAYLCGTGTTGCHGFIEHNRREAYARGFLLRTGLDPRLVAMVAPWRK